FMSPRSRGAIDMGGEDLQIRLRFFEGSGTVDLDALAAGIDIARDVASHIRVAEMSDPAPTLRKGTLRQWILGHPIGYAHAVGTCRMGTDNSSVVDARGRVRGLDNVHVGDASIVPVIPRANTNLLCLLIGMRIAQML